MVAVEPLVTGPAFDAVGLAVVIGLIISCLIGLAKMAHERYRENREWNAMKALEADRRPFGVPFD